MKGYTVGTIVEKKWAFRLFFVFRVYIPSSLVMRGMQRLHLSGERRGESAGRAELIL